jgi:choline-sulfatase
MKLGTASTPPNILFIITDQQRDFRHWPEGWAEQNLPSFQRLEKHGLKFRSAFNNTCMCSPSRASFWTSTFPAENGVQSTGGILKSGQLTMGDVLSKAHYQTAYCGKWHLGGNTSSPSVTPPDFAFASSWDAPDAGIQLGPGSWQGAGRYNNDQRILGTVSGDQDHPPQTGDGPSVLEFLESYDGQAPFFLVASFVNPHDVGVAPFGYQSAGYDPSQWAGLGIPVPDTWDENLSTKPSVQSWYQTSSKNADVPQWTDDERQSYVNFYAYLQKLVDQDIEALLCKLDELGLTDNTIIFRFSDHGEMALSHGLIEKAFNAYEETIHIPLIISNPQLFPEPRETPALASLIDLLPTVASIAGVLDQYPGQFKGVDLSSLFSTPDQDVQSCIHFTFDDSALGTPPAGTPWHIRALREKDWLYAAYFADGSSGGNPPAMAYELYDLRNDPEQTKNLASPEHITPESRKELDRLNLKLIEVMKQDGTMPGFNWPEKPQIG